MNRNFKMVLQYEGTRYNGWQKQGNTSDTIQGKLEQILERMAGEPVEVQGSGRTDAGVHAAGQTANFRLSDGFFRSRGLFRQEEAYLKSYLNRYLPDDIGVLSVEEVPERFHSRLSAERKTYLYQIETGEKQDVFQRRLSYHLGHSLDTEVMRLAAERLCGTHDFRSFCGNRKMKKSTVRTLYSVDICQKPGSSLVTLSFTGNGFLQNMVRILTGTLIEIGLGERDWRTVDDILRAKDRQAAGFTAPAEGLCLVQVIYEEMK